MLVVLAGTGLFLRLRLEANLDQSTNRDLSSRAADLISVIKAGEFRLGEPVRGVLSAQGASLAQVLTWRGALFDPKIQRDKTGRPFLSRAEVEQAHRGPVFVERSGVPTLGDEPVRMLATPVGFERHRLIVVVGASLSARDDALQSLTTLLLIGGPVALLLASLAAYGTVRAALRPVDAMRRRAAEISAAEAEQRLPLPPASDELRRLGETLNRMLDRLQAAVERERAFVDDASHELRTPLALHKTELELALRYGESPEELRAAIASAIEEADRLSQLAEDLLTLARSDKGRMSIETKPVEVRDVFAAVRSRLGGAAHEAGRSFVVDDPDGLVVQADPARVEQALANLVENGLRHGDGQIRLWARAREDGVELHVSDAGPGFPAEFLPHAFERFRRADTARSESGAGLGLAIVDAIAQAHSGQAAARNTPEGGADVWIELGRAG
jgi:signal transduction histidine kinase